MDQDEPPAKTLRSPSLTSEEFTDLVMEAFRAHDLVAKVTRVGPMHLEVELVTEWKFKTSLDNIWLACRDRPADRPALVEGFINALEQASQVPEEEPDLRHAIVPIVRNEKYMQEANKVYQGEDQVAAEPLVADLWILYAVDRPDALTFLRRSSVEAIGLDGPSLLRTAVANLEGQLGGLRRRTDKTGSLRLLTLEGTFESSLLLFFDLWKQLQKEVVGDLIACVPSRSAVFYTGSQEPHGMELLLEAAHKVYAQGDHVVSCSPIRWHGSGWEALPAN